MKTLLLLGVYAFSTLSAAEPTPVPEPEYVELESRQLPQLAGAAIGGLIGLGALGQIAGALNSFGRGNAPCKCALPRCDGTNVRTLLITLLLGCSC
jgi:hypothetical protein